MLGRRTRSSKLEFRYRLVVGGRFRPQVTLGVANFFHNTCPAGIGWIFKPKANFESVGLFPQ